VKRRPRRLKPDELQLWQSVARSTKPLSAVPARAAIAVKGAPAPAPESSDEPAPARAPIAPFTIGQKAGARDRAAVTFPPAQEQMQKPVRMDRKAFGRMSGGRIAPEARIDLHGMTLAEAHPALIGFIMRAQARGLRLVLVITGKGRGGAGDDGGAIPSRPGALRRQVPLWLRAAPLGPLVLEVQEAHRRHGGAGACYVYLRRNRA
jgi:DNA-nicking Smr family endonuclease